MDFLKYTDELKKICKQIKETKHLVDDEVGTKNSFINPFICALGYDVKDPRVVDAEYIADVAVKKRKRKKRVDYAILENSKPIILIECKGCYVDLTDEHKTQLSGYFDACDARIAVLTNGIKYLFFSDIENKNKMDENPFMRMDLSEHPSEKKLKEVFEISRNNFDLKKIVSFAYKHNWQMRRKFRGGGTSEVEKEMIIEDYHEALRSYGAEMGMRLERVTKEERFKIIQKIILERMAELSSDCQKYFSKFLVVFAESDLIEQDLFSASDLSSIEDDLKSVVVIYARGDWFYNPGFGGWAALLSYGDFEKMVMGGSPRTTDKRMELTAVIEGLKFLHNVGRVNLGVYTTSGYVCDGVNAGWIKHWKRNGWKTREDRDVKNQDLWLKLDDHLKKHDTRFFQLESHGAVEGTKKVDRALWQAREQYINSKDDWVKRAS